MTTMGSFRKELADRLLILNRLPRLFWPILSGVLLGLVVLVILSELALANKIYPGVTAGGVNLSGQTREQAAANLIKATESATKSNLTLRVNEEEEALNLTDLSFNLDYQKTLDQALRVGRDSNYLVAVKNRLQTLILGSNLPAEFSINEEALKENVSSFAARVDQNPVDAGVSISGSTVTVTPSKIGAKLDQEAVLAQIKAQLTYLQPKALNLSLSTAYPQVYEADAQKAKVEAEAAISAPIKLTWRGQSWTTSIDKIASFLSFTQQESVTSLASVEVGSEVIKIGPVKLLAAGEDLTGNPDLKLSLDKEKLNTHLNTVAASIDQVAVDARFQYVGGKIQGFAAEREGREVDREVLAGKILETLAKTDAREVEVPVKVTQPRVTLAELNNLGIKELLGRGVSKYAGSSAERILNLSLGAARINGTLVAPGQTFSMYQTVGDISIESGYAVGLIIANGRTVPGVGGGICQVSTTLFRSVLNAGLPILERNPHAYRVGYYEQNAAAGLDASVYFPYSDFRFRNDTGNYVLLQTINDRANSTLIFEIYGTSDGRQVSVTSPSVTNIIPAPAPLYQDDPTLAKGTVKQVDFAANGATAVFSRTVTRDGQLLYKDTFYTKYRPWQAIFLVGTKES